MGFMLLREQNVTFVTGFHLGSSINFTVCDKASGTNMVKARYSKNVHFCFSDYRMIQNMGVLVNSKKNSTKSVSCDIIKFQTSMSIGYHTVIQITI
jgi:hypothetical protein